jgi:hypothetical protein
MFFFFWHSAVLEADSTQEGLDKLKKKIVHLIGYLTLDLAVCSIAPQPLRKA